VLKMNWDARVRRGREVPRARARGAAVSYTRAEDWYQPRLNAEYPAGNERCRTMRVAAGIRQGLVGDICAARSPVAAPYDGRTAW
jgi:hypothetical protein